MEETNFSSINNPCYSRPIKRDQSSDINTESDEKHTVKVEANDYEPVVSQHLKVAQKGKTNVTAFMGDVSKGSLDRLLIAVIVLAIASIVMSILAFSLSLWVSTRPPVFEGEISSNQNNIQSLWNLVRQMNNTLLTHESIVADVSSSLNALRNAVDMDLNYSLNTLERSIGNLMHSFQFLSAVFQNESEHVNYTFSSHESAIQTLAIGMQTLTSFLSLKPVPECGPGNWLRVAFLNMSDSSQHCPPAWREYTTPVRSCGRPVTSSGSCPSNLFGTHGYTYTKVCGRATGYQYSSTDAFHLLPSVPEPQTVDDMYVDGISLTHGTPRTHIWTLAAGHTDSTTDLLACPCINSSEANPSPPFIGNNFFCESGTTIRPAYYPNTSYFSNDPLWDGEECVNSQCCTFNSPPWFSVRLPSFTTDDIEVRICADESTANEDIPIELLEVYIQ